MTFQTFSRLTRVAFFCGLLGQLHAQTVPLSTGRTFVRLSTQFVSALTTLSVQPSVDRPARLENGIVSFPIVGGVVDSKTARGEILHTGSLFLTSGTTRVQLSEFLIDTTGSAPRLTGLVSANGSVVGRITLFNLQVPSLILPLQPAFGRFLQLDGIPVTLAADAAQALNQVFGGNNFGAGIQIGTATSTILLRVEPDLGLGMLDIPAAGAESSAVQRIN